MANWRMAFRDYSDGPSFWPECKRRGVAAITYKPVADVDFGSHARDDAAPGWRALEPTQKGCLKHFIDNMRIGDVIYVKDGPSIVGKGVVAGEYEFDAAGPISVPEGDCLYHHQRRVRWSPDFVPVNVQVGHPPIQALLQLRDEEVAAIEEAERARQSST